MNEEYPTWAPQRWWQDKCNAQAKRIEELEAELEEYRTVIETVPDDTPMGKRLDWQIHECFLLTDKKRLLEAILQRAANEAPDCSCLDDYKKRGRIDPTCVRCNHFAPWIDDAKKALEGKR